MIPRIGRLDLLEHGDGAARVDQGEVLRGRHDDRAGQRRLLRHGELHVAGAGGHINDEGVEFAPGDIAQKLRQRLGDHRPPPDHWRIFIDEKAHGHDLDAMGLEGNELAAFDLGLFIEAEEPRRRRAINVGVEEADAPPLRGEAERKIGGRRRFADAALARGDGDYETDLLQRRRQTATLRGARRRVSCAGP